MRLLLSLTIIGIAFVSTPVAASSPLSSPLSAGSVDQKSMRLSKRKLYSSLSKRKLYSSLSKRGSSHGKKKKKKHGKEEEGKKKEGGGSLIPADTLKLPPTLLPSLPTLPSLPPLQLPALPALFGGGASS